MKNKFIIITLFVMVIVSLGLSLLNYNSSVEVGYFNFNEVYNKSSLKLSLENDLKETLSGKNSLLDSLNFELSLLSNKIEGNQAMETDYVLFEDMKNRFLTLNEKFNEENEQLKEDYYVQINNEINQKSISFCKENKIDFLLSANGSGVLMYGIETSDLTEEFLKHINN